MMNIEKGKSKFLSFFDIHHDGECQNFFFAFRFPIFEFEFRKAKKENQTKLLLLINMHLYFEQENTLLIGKITVFSKFTRCG